MADFGKLKQQYGTPETAQDSRKSAQQSFSIDDKVATSTPRRISSSPGNTDDAERAATFKEYTEMQMLFGQLTEEEGKLNLRFKDMVGKDKWIMPGDVAKMVMYNLTFQRTKAKQVKYQALGRKRETLIELGNRIGEVITEKYQKITRIRELINSVQIRNVADIQHYNSAMVERVTNGYNGDADYDEIQQIVAGVNADLKTSEELVEGLEKQLFEARKANDVEKVKQITSQLTQIVAEQGTIWDRKLDVDGISLNVKRKIMDYATSIKSGKNARDAAKLSYDQINLIIDSVNKIESEYKWMQEDMIRIFKTQAETAAYGTSALEMTQYLDRIMDGYRKMMDYNCRMAKTLANSSSELLRKTVYDPQEMRKQRNDMIEFLVDRNQKDLKWAQEQQYMSQVLQEAEQKLKQGEVPTLPGYTKQK